MASLLRCLLIFLFIGLVSSCEKSEVVTTKSIPVIIALTVSDIEKSMDWYGRHLSFTSDTLMQFPGYGVTVGMMHQGDFYLEFVKFENDLSPSELGFPSGSSALNGFYKIGFQVNDLEALYEQLSTKPDVEVIAPLGGLIPVKGVPWPEQYFLLADPDGNYVQFFSTPPGSENPAEQISPFLIASSSPNLDRSIDWYTRVLDAKLIDRVGNPGNERAMLEKDGLMIELGAFEGYVPLDSTNIPGDFELSQIHGIRKLSFLVPYIYQPYDRMLQNEVPFDFDLTEQKSMVGDRYFMVSDDIGNALQFFERDQPEEQ